MSTPKQPSRTDFVASNVDEEFDKTAYDYTNTFDSKIASVIDKNQSREDFDPYESKLADFSYSKREKDFKIERNKKQPRHLQCSYPLELEVRTLY